MIDYSPSLDHKIKNTESLPRGLGCKFLLCLIAHNGEYIAHSWKRTEPKKVKSGYAVIRFK